MNKRDLVVSLSERLSLTQSQSVEIVNAWEGVLTDALQSGERLTLQGFGTFFCLEPDRADRTQSPNG
ncbi:HU family DNA-binding protein [Parabacteroides goldsteinii]|uniref:HU family DNA-binding protein n=1 Tax=Parabacteroides goldsteinii TaxID=328812 RepID=UPI003EB7D501